MNQIAVISSILEKPKVIQEKFNDVVSEFRGNIRGRMGLPLDDGISVISLTVTGELDDINELTQQLENIQGVAVKTVVANIES